MSRSVILPKKSRYIPTNNIFSASFNSPSYGVYDFGVAANAGQTVIVLQPNTVYFVDYFSVSGNIASETFLSVISTQPYLTFSKKTGGVLFTQKIPVSSFSAENPIGQFLDSQIDGDEIQASFTGVLSQNSDLVGVSPVSLNLKLSIYAMDEREYNEAYRAREGIPGKGF
jgi:hypothetical protein